MMLPVIQFRYFNNFSYYIRGKMAQIKEFYGLRPRTDMAQLVSELPYDVVNSEEARNIAKDNDYSVYHIIKPEIDLPPDTNPYDSIVYETGRNNLNRFIDDKILTNDTKPSLYLYTQSLDNHSQTGILTCVNIDDYLNNKIKKHELTREEKELDRLKHIDTVNAQVGPVFLLYNEDGSKSDLFSQALKIEPVYDFVAEDGVQHILRKVEEPHLIKAFKNSFVNDDLYIADGHHRMAAAARLGKERRLNKKNYTDNDEFNWVLAVIFPHNQLKILPYNRAVKTEKSFSMDIFMEKLGNNFEIEKVNDGNPSKKGQFNMYLEGSWYSLIPKFNTGDSQSERLDVSILQNSILSPLLNIDNPRTNKRIEFVGGIKGTRELEIIVDKNEYSLAFSMYPTSIEELIAVSDSGEIMPPKSTWFEPKLRSGLVIHLLDM